MVMGLGQSVFMPYSARILGGLFSSQQRGMVFGVFNFSIYLAFAVVLSLGTFMMDEYGWQMGYFVFGLLGCVVGMFIPCAVTRPEDGGRLDSLCYLDGYRNISKEDEGAFLESIQSEKLPVDGPSDDFNVDKPLLQSLARMSQEILQSDTLEESVAADLSTLFSFWRSQPSLSLLCCAMGVRLGGGYIWSAYTAVFFSELYVDEDQSCRYR